jgi:predicted amidohydrolase YtcJ
MYTTGGAYGAHLEGSSGDLRVGQLANFGIFDRNWFDGPAENIHNAKNLCTYFEGKLVSGSC